MSQRYFSRFFAGLVGEKRAPDVNVCAFPELHTKFKAGAGWTFVTGEKQEMDKLLNSLGVAVSKKDHTPAMIIGNDSKGVWTRTYGLAKIPQIVGVIQNVMAGKSRSLPRQRRSGREFQTHASHSHCHHYFGTRPGIGTKAQAARAGFVAQNGCWSINEGVISC